MTDVITKDTTPDQLTCNVPGVTITGIRYYSHDDRYLITFSEPVSQDATISRGDVTQRTFHADGTSAYAPRNKIVITRKENTVTRLLELPAAELMLEGRPEIKVTSIRGQVVFFSPCIDKYGKPTGENSEGGWTYEFDGRPAIIDTLPRLVKRNAIDWSKPIIQIKGSCSDEREIHVCSTNFVRHPGEEPVVALAIKERGRWITNSNPVFRTLDNKAISGDQHGSALTFANKPEITTFRAFIGHEGAEAEIEVSVRDNVVVGVAIL